MSRRAVSAYCFALILLMNCSPPPARAADALRPVPIPAPSPPQADTASSFNADLIKPRITELSEKDAADKLNGCWSILDPKQCTAHSGISDHETCYGSDDSQVVDPERGYLRQCTERERSIARAAAKARFAQRKREEANRIAREAASNAALREAADRAHSDCLTKDIPRIGMTQSEAANSRWGRPWDINETITSLGNHEQWVYRGYLPEDECGSRDNSSKFRFLYFENGRLVAIQR